MEVNICRLCLNLAKKEFEVIDAVTSQMLDVLLLKVDLYACENPILCQDCAEVVKKLYYFKSACIDTEELICSYSAANESSEFDIKDVYRGSKGMSIATDEDYNICRLCMEHIGKNFVPIEILMNDALYMEMLPVFMPTMVLNNIKDPVICTSCRENIRCYFKFIRSCLDTEEKIIKYRQNEGLNNMSPIKLSAVLGFLFKFNIECSVNYAPITKIKQERFSEPIEQNEVFEMHYNERIKSETLDIKDEDVSLENNILKVEMYKCDSCTYETKYKNALKAHKLTHMDASEVEMHKCGMCTFETKHKNTLKRHSLIHKDSSEIEMHKCRLCSYETKRKQTLKKHMLIHKDSADVEMYKCAICTYETKYKNDHKNHMLIHKDVSEVEMYKCDLCTYETKYKRHMKRHMLNHKETSEVEMHKCEICTYKTKHKDNLRKHMLIHKDALKCGMCRYETKHKRNLKKHIQGHKDFVCKEEIK